ncbi:unnamed protein product [Larinioides sclopetarius]|uniref:Uncharacterized protein n=1 Tax=Larinioides sclopetarius TaxID=280406 RepID=A0AAV2BY80_9ARAC
MIGQSFSLRSTRRNGDKLLTFISLVVGGRS